MQTLISNTSLLIKELKNYQTIAIKKLMDHVHVVMMYTQYIHMYRGKLCIQTSFTFVDHMQSLWQHKHFSKVEQNKSVQTMSLTSAC